MRCRASIRGLPAAVALSLGISLFGLAGAPIGAWAAPRIPLSRTHRHAKPKVVPSEVLLSPALTTTPGAPVSMAPVGLSIEYPVMAADLGSEACPPPALVAELLRLGSPPLELAGVSQDMTAPSGALSAAPSSWETATLYSLPNTFWSQMRCLLTSSKDPLTVGLNLKTGDLAWAAQMAAEAQGAAPNGLSFSIGNEPDLYQLPNYSSLDKTFAGQEAASANLYLQLVGALRPAIGGLALIGPEMSRPANWRNQLPHVIEALHEQTVGVHLYPLTTCATPRAVTIGGLLSSDAAQAPTRLSWVAADARAQGLPAIISEANSASCGGLAGVSDSPAAAVWAVRFVLSALKSGFQEVRFHSAGDPYDPFLVHGSEILTRPIESALVALNQWLPVGSTLRTLPGVRELQATAIGQPGGGTVVILDNEQAKTRPVLLRDADSVQTDTFTPSSTELQPGALSSASARIRLTVPANSVVAISIAP